MGRDDLVVHAANSAATLREPRSHFDLVRCGIAIYGMDPFHEDPAAHGLEPALALRSWVAAVRRFDAGDSAGYGRRWTAREPTWVATVPIGYGDGWRRALSNDCDVLIGGRRHPLVGTVSMDNVTVALGPDTDVSVGDEVVLIGAQGDERILAEEVARRLGTINYEVTCAPLAAGAARARAVSDAWIVGGALRDELLGPPGARRGHRGGRRPRAAGPGARRPSCAARCSGSRRRSAPGG